MNKIIIHVVTLLFLSCSVHASVDEAAAKKFFSKRGISNYAKSSFEKTKTFDSLDTIGNEDSHDNSSIFKNVGVYEEYEDLTPLHIAVLRNNIDLVGNLLATHKNKNIQDNEGNTPLHVATGNGYLEIVILLLEYGANPNILNEEGNTPLHIASENNFTDIAQLLILPNDKTKKNIKNHEENTAFDLAESQEMRDILT